MHKRKEGWTKGVALSIGCLAVIAIASGLACSTYDTQLGQPHTKAVLAPQFSRSVTKTVSAPEFTAQTLTGKNIEFLDLRGNTVLLYFWCTCGMHRREVLYIQNLYDEYHNFIPIIISQDAFGVRDELISEYQLTMDIVDDDSNRILGLYNFRGVPNAVLIDPDGNFQALALGRYETQEEFRNMLGVKPPAKVVDSNPDEQPLTVSNLRVISITSYSALVRWDTNIPTTSEIIVKRLISNSEESSYADGAPTTRHLAYVRFTPYIQGDDTTYNYHKLTIKVRQSNGGTAQYGLSFCGQHADNKEIGKVTNMQISNITDRSALVTWRTTEKAKCRVTIPSRGVELAIQTPYGDSHSQIITCLEPGRLHSIQIKAQGEIGESLSDIASFETGKLRETGMEIGKHAPNILEVDKSIYVFKREYEKELDGLICGGKSVVYIWDAKNEAQERQLDWLIQFQKAGGTRLVGVSLGADDKYALNLEGRSGTDSSAFYYKILDPKGMLKNYAGIAGSPLAIFTDKDTIIRDIHVGLFDSVHEIESIVNSYE